jgi:hypothetical protein
MIDSVALDPATMAGTYMVSGLLMLAGLIWHYFSHLLDKHNIRPAVIDVKPHVGLPPTCSTDTTAVL